MTTIVFDLIVKTTNPLNGGHPGTKWAAIQRSKARAEHRLVARLRTTAALRQARVHAADVIPCVVTLTRYSAGKMDTDGLAASQKGIRDGIADALGVNDGGPAVSWDYDQAKCPKGVFGVRVRIEKRESNVVRFFQRKGRVGLGMMVVMVDDHTVRAVRPRDQGPFMRVVAVEGERVGTEGMA